MIMARIEKYYYRYFISPVVKRYALYLSPGWITFLSCMMGVFSFIGLINHNLGVAALCLIGSGYLDTLDGEIANAQYKSSLTGLSFGLIADRCTEVAILLGLFLYSPATRLWPCILVVLSLYLFITIALSTHKILGKLESTASTPAITFTEQIEIFLFFLGMILFPQHFLVLAIIFSLCLWVFLIERLQLLWRYRNQAKMTKSKTRSGLLC